MSPGPREPGTNFRPGEPGLEPKPANPAGGPDQRATGPPISTEKTGPLTSTEKIGNYYAEADQAMSDYLTELGWPKEPDTPGADGP